MSASKAIISGWTNKLILLVAFCQSRRMLCESERVVLSLLEFVYHVLI